MLRREINLGAELTEVARMNDWLQALARDAGLPDGVRDDIKLCLNEAVANVMMYGTAEHGALRIHLSVAASATGAQAVLADTAQAFNPLEHPEPAKIASLEEARIGGFGISLIRATAGQLSYVRDGGSNRLTIVCGAP